MILQVHDELMFEVDPTALDDVKQLVRSKMEGALRLDVPIAVDMGVGASWFEAKAS